MARQLTLNDGIKPFLNITAHLHNGRDYSDFEVDIGRLNEPDDTEPFRVTVSGLAKVWGVHRHTFQSWIEQYNEEHDTDND